MTPLNPHASRTHPPSGTVQHGAHDRPTDMQSAGTLPDDGIPHVAQLRYAAAALDVDPETARRMADQGTLDTLQALAARLTHERGAPPLVVIDYLQRVPAPANLSGREIRERVAYIAGHLQVALAREIGCPVLALSSLGRDQLDRGLRLLERLGWLRVVKIPPESGRGRPSAVLRLRPDLLEHLDGAS